MTASCDGCTECCKVVAISSRKASKVVQEDLPYWKPLSTRQAKKRNPRLVRFFKNKNTPLYYKCRRLTETGCAIHGKNNYVCSEYPLYGKTAKRYVEIHNTQYAETEYTEHCNYLHGLIKLEEV